MRILIPESITESKITASSADAETVADYDPNTTYQPGNPGDRAVDGNMVYEAVEEVSGVPPSEGVKAVPPSWIEVRTVNPLAMWNGVIGDATEGSEPWPVHGGEGIQIEVEPGRIIGGVAFFALDASSVRVEVVNGADGVVYDQTVSLRDVRGINTYWRYWFDPLARRRDVIFDGLPAYKAKVRISIQKPGSSSARCGVCVMGSIRTLGCLTYSSGGGVMSFSRRVRDEFGRLLLREGDVAKTFSYQISMDKNRSDEGVRLLTDLDAKRLVFIGTESFESSLVYGIYEDFRFTYENYAFHKYTLEVTGLT